jgi:hypothetical protein
MHRTKHDRLFDHLIGGGEQRLQHVEAERLERSQTGAAADAVP